mgnify:FL=1
MNMKRRFYYARVAVRRIPPPIVAVTSLFVLWYERDRLRSFGIRASLKGWTRPASPKRRATKPAIVVKEH